MTLNNSDNIPENAFELGPNIAATPLAINSQAKDKTKKKKQNIKIKKNLTEKIYAKIKSHDLEIFKRKVLFAY